MLFSPPTLTLKTVRTAAPASNVLVSGRGCFSNVMVGSGQPTATSLHTDVCTAPGWLSVQHPQIFMAGRTKSLGTELLALFETVVRAAPGWLSARTLSKFGSDKSPDPGQLVDFSLVTDCRTALGWLSVRRLYFSLAGRTKSLGTELLALFETGFRAASGWLSARSLKFSLTDDAAGSGQLAASSKLSNGCTAPGWLSVRPSAFISSPLPRLAAANFSEVVGPRDYHLPVFPSEIGDWMAAGPGKFIIDGTLGGGGHSEIFLNAGARVLGVDRDPEALAHARARLADFGDRFSTWEGNFSQVSEIPEIQQGIRADGLLMDLGVSSRQLDSAARGFSFMREGPLDMRMGPSSPRTAADIVNRWPEADLVKILFEFGEESRARRIAGAIVKQRAVQPFVTTLDLASYIEKIVGRHGKTHPATKTFQAIRMAVNEELESLATALTRASSVLKPGGLLLIITFHSLEDRLVKRFLKHRSTEFLDDPAWPEPRPNPDHQYRLLARKAIAPTPEEIHQNPRARSAKLRVAQLLASTS